jgi:hypothetical protein
MRTNMMCSSTVQRSNDEDDGRARNYDDAAVSHLFVRSFVHHERDTESVVYWLR